MSIFDELRTLAGVTEKYQTGSSGQAKGKDPMPKTSKPSANGEQPHPLKGKLVGDSTENNDVAVQEKDKPKSSGKLAAAIASINKDIEGDDPNMLIARGMQKTVAGEVLTPNEREALGPYVDLIVKILTTPQLRASLVTMNKMLKGQDKKDESIKEKLYRELKRFH